MKYREEKAYWFAKVYNAVGEIFDQASEFTDTSHEPARCETIPDWIQYILTEIDTSIANVFCEVCEQQDRDRDAKLVALSEELC